MKPTTYIEWIVTFTTESEGIKRTTEVTVNALTALTAITEAHERTSVNARYVTSLDLRRR